MTIEAISNVVIHTFRKGKSFFSQFNILEKNSILTHGSLMNKSVSNDNEGEKKIMGDMLNETKETKEVNENVDYSLLNDIINKFGPDKIEEILRIKKENEISVGHWVLTKYKPEFREVKKVDLTKEDGKVRYEITGLKDTEYVWVYDEDIIDKYKPEKELTNIDLLFLYKGRKPNQWKLGDVAIISTKSIENGEQLDFYSTQLMFVDSEIDLQILDSVKKSKTCIPLVFREGRLDYLYLDGITSTEESRLKPGENIKQPDYDFAGIPGIPIDDKAIATDEDDE